MLHDDAITIIIESQHYRMTGVQCKFRNYKFIKTTNLKGSRWVGATFDGNCF